VGGCGALRCLRVVLACLVERAVRRRLPGRTLQERGARVRPFLARGDEEIAAPERDLGLLQHHERIRPAIHVVAGPVVRADDPASPRGRHGGERRLLQRNVAPRRGSHRERVIICRPGPAASRRGRAASLASAGVRGQIKCAVGHITCAGCRPYPAPSLLRPLLSLRPCLRTALSSPHAAPTALPVQTDPRILCATDAGSAHLTCDRPRILCAIDRRSRLFSAHFICPLTATHVRRQSF